PCDLRHLERVGQAGAVIITLVLDENLGFMLQAPECRGMNDAVAVALIASPCRAFLLRPAAPEAFCQIRGIGRTRRRGELRPQKASRTRQVGHRSVRHYINLVSENMIGCW